MRLQSMSLTLFLVCLFPFYASAKELTVAVAANVQYAFDELSTQFEKDTGIKIKKIVGSSGKFTTQIENGAPFDVFLSADMEYPQALDKEGLTVESPKVYAFGTLVIWTLNNVDLSNGMRAFAGANVRKIAIASPQAAPYGRQAVNALKHSNLYTQTEKKLVYGESIAQVNQFIQTGAADLGITAKSVVMAPQMKDQGKWIEVPNELYEPIAQGAVILKHAEGDHLQEAKNFFEFLFSAKAGALLKKYGYVLPEEEAR